MGTRFCRVGRTTDLVEQTIKMVDRILSEGFHWSPLVWRWRELYASKERDSGASITRLQYWVEHTSFVKIVGLTSEGHHVTAIATFEGFTDIVGNPDDFEDAEDRSQEPLMAEVFIEIRTRRGTTISKTLYMENFGRTFFFRRPTTSATEEMLPE